MFLALSIFCAQAGAQNADVYSSAVKTKKQRSREFGIRAGYNIPRLAGEKKMSLKPGTQNGYTVSVSYSPAAKGGLGFRSELVYSIQKFGFTENGKKTDLQHQYIYLPQFTTIGMGKFLQLQVGGQIGVLLNAKQSEGSSRESVVSLMNKLDYGAAAGLEIYPFKGLVVGGRYNMNFGKSYKTPSAGGSINPLPFNPADVKGSNAVINFYLGYKF